MKTLRAVAAALAVCVILSACGGSPAPASANSAPADRMISTPEPIITPPPPDDGLTDAERQIRAELAGEWVDVNSYFEQGDGTGMLETLFADEWGGDTWELSADGKTIGPYRIVDDDGITLLIRSGQSLTAPVQVSYILVRREQFRDFFNRYFVEVDVTGENIHEYVNEPVYIGEYETVDSWGDVNGTAEAWTCTSPVYDSGLVFIGAGRNFRYEAIYNGYSADIRYPYGIQYGAGGYTGAYTIGRAEGRLFFVRSEYVTDNTVETYTEAYDRRARYARVVTILDGIRIATENRWVDGINYDDWKY